MKLNIKRYEKNPIVTGGTYKWRKAGSFNPGVIYDNGVFYMLERAIEGLRPLVCHAGLLTSTDGFNFSPAAAEPVFSAAKNLGFKDGTVEDPRIVKIDGKFYITYACRPHTYNCHPNGIRVPDYYPLKGELDKGVNHTLSGIAVSSDLRSFTQVAMINDETVDERDVMLFPEKINGKFAILRRPRDYYGEKYGCSGPSIWISYSDDLLSWTEPALVAQPEFSWEGAKIGAGAPPIKTDAGWLLIYHGVDGSDVYRVGAMLLDIKDPTKVIGRTRGFIMEPEEYYEKFGLIIPNVIFPTGTVVKDGLLYIYYGCCDTCISAATVNINELISFIKGGGN